MLIDIGRYVGHHFDQVLTVSWPKGTLVHHFTRFMWQTSSIFLLGLEYDDKWHIFSNHPTLLIFQIFIKLFYERAVKEQQGEGGEEGFRAAWAYEGEKTR